MKGEIKYDRLGNQIGFYLNGKEVTKEAFDEAIPTRPIGVPLNGHSPACWPMLSDALAVHPKQIPAVMERNKQHGLHVEYNPTDGRPVLMDRGMRRDLMKLEAIHDNNGGYGDDHR